MKNRVLIVSSHMDDEVLGCAGAISKHCNQGNKVWVVFIAHRIYNHLFDIKKNNIEKDHALKARRVLGYREAIFLDLEDERLDSSVQEIIIPLEKIVENIKPNIIYIPFRGDNNQDHRAVFDACRVVFRPMVNKFVKIIRMYEVPSSTEQSPPLLENAFLPNYYVDISNLMEKKIKAIKCYETEKRNFPHPRSAQAVKILAQKRGTEIGFKYAEAFVTIRESWD